jgi:nucleoside-diphosphate-sugar epimerase
VETLLLAKGTELGIGVTVLEPSCVYGPYSTAFTLTPVADLRRGRVALAENGAGICNLVYIDDLVNAMVLSSQLSGASGERFLVSGPETVTWRSFYRAYENMLGLDSIISLPFEQLLAMIDGPHRATTILREPRMVREAPAIRAMLPLARRLLGRRLWTSAKRAAPRPVVLPDRNNAMFRTSSGVVRIERAQEILTYQPEFTFARGMALTEAYVRWAHL